MPDGGWPGRACGPRGARAGCEPTGGGCYSAVAEGPYPWHSPGFRMALVASSGGQTATSEGYCSAQLARAAARAQRSASKTESIVTGPVPMTASGEYP